ncbi:MAG: hypothetical protein ACLTNY_00165 [Blautia massiliensis (ex Durand et al. 2017)]
MAISIYFAILAVNPAPFCMDEIKPLWTMPMWCVLPSTYAG